MSLRIPQISQSLSVLRLFDVPEPHRRITKTVRPVYSGRGEDTRRRILKRTPCELKTHSRSWRQTSQPSLTSFRCLHLVL